MTQPGSVIAPQPGWWVKTEHIGTAEGTYGWAGHASGPHAGQASGTWGYTSDAHGIETPFVVAEVATEVETSNAVLNFHPAKIQKTISETENVTAALNTHRVVGAARSLTENVASALHRITPVAVGRTVTATVTAGITKPPPAFDAVGAGNSSTGTTSLTFSHTATAGATAILWVMFANTVANGSISAQYGGSSMTQIGSSFLFGSSGGFSYYLAGFKFANAPSGAQTVTVSPAASSFVNANTESYLYVSSVGALTTNSATSTSPALTVSSTTGHMVAQCFGVPSGAVQSSYNQTSRWAQNGTGTWASSMQIGDAAGAASVSFSETISSSTFWGAVGVDLI